MNRKIEMIARILMGLMFVVFGANGLMMSLTGAGFIPMPPPKPEMMTVMGGIMGMVYLMPLIKMLEVIGGIMLLTNKFVNLSIVLLAPIVVNILGIHLFVDLAGAPMAIFITLLQIIIIKSRWNSFKPLLSMN